nr:MAG TPA: hypothetical protein [Caudoviricetes sp.]
MLSLSSFHLWVYYSIFGLKCQMYNGAILAK